MLASLDQKTAHEYPIEISRVPRTPRLRPTDFILNAARQALVFLSNRSILAALRIKRYLLGAQTLEKFGSKVPNCGIDRRDKIDKIEAGYVAAGRRKP